MGDAVEGGPRRTRDASGGVQVGDFDARALFEALDRQRLERALSWRQVAEAIWVQSSELNDRRHDHPIAVETITGMWRRNNISCQHALFMLRWLGRAPEEFVPRPVEGSVGVGLPMVGPDRRLRWNLAALHEAMDTSRREQHLTWKSLADHSGLHSEPVDGHQDCPLCHWHAPGDAHHAVVGSASL